MLLKKKLACLPLSSFLYKMVRQLFIDVTHFGITHKHSTSSQKMFWDKQSSLFYQSIGVNGIRLFSLPVMKEKLACLASSSFLYKIVYWQVQLYINIATTAHFCLTPKHRTVPKKLAGINILAYSERIFVVDGVKTFFACNDLEEKARVFVLVELL
jgi:hypothetical protein